MTPIQELVKHFVNAVESVIEKEKDFARKCFEAGQLRGGDEVLGTLKDFEPTQPDFETFYKSQCR